MLLEILKREIRDHLTSLRLILTFSLVLILMGASAFMFDREYKRQLEDFSLEQNKALADFGRQASSSYPLFTAFSWGMQRVHERPNPAAFIAEGHDRDLPNSYSVNAFKIIGPAFTLRSNPMLWKFDSLDWAFIVSVILSFAAIVLVYDSVNGEKERGTLRLLMSNPVPRETVLLGKYFASVIVLVLPLAAGVLLNLAILTAGGSIRLSWDLAGKVGVALVLCILYLSAFALLGLFLSARMRQPVASLVTGLLIWVAAVIVIPAAGNLLARGLVKIPSQDRVLEEADRVWGEAKENYDRARPHPDNWIMSGGWSPGEPLLRAFEAWRAHQRVVRQYEDLQTDQVLLGQRIARMSPAALFSETLEEIAETGVFHYRSFLGEVRRYRETLAEYVSRKFPFDPSTPMHNEKVRQELEKMKLDFDSVPKFEDRFAPAAETSRQALGNAGILALLNLVLFAATYVSFLRYDVR
jgi:ABC-type transport system involved in multi-copper enzyme maturation permease subunit